MANLHPFSRDHQRRGRWAALAASIGLSAWLGALAPLPAQEAPKASERTAHGPSKPVTVPFDMLPTNHIVMEAKINGEGPYRLIFDVGSPVTLLSTRAGKEAKVIKPNAATLFLFSAAGEADVKSLELGDLDAKDVPVIVMDHPVVKALGDILGKPLDGLIGHSFFARFKTTIDYQAKKMTFESVDAKEVPDLFADLPKRLTGPKRARTVVLTPAALWGLEIEPAADPGTQGVRIRWVRSGSAAEAAGLQPGDLLLELDGRWTTNMADAFDAAAKIEPGRAVPVKIRRGDEERVVEVTPRAGL